MAVTRIKNNQITDSTIVANAKVVDYSISASKLANNLTYGSDLTISGNLTVNGSTTTVDTINTLIEDPILVLADGQTSGSPVVDIGILGYRGNQNSSFIGWKESASTFMAILSNTTVSNTTVNVTSYADFTASTITAQANLSVVGNIIGNANFSGNLTAGNVLTPGLVSATANITGGNILTGGLISATSTITSAANITGGNVLTGGLISATSTITSAANITGGNILTGGLISATGNITGGNIISGNAVIGNINVSGNIIVNSLTSNTFVSASGNVTGGNVLTGGLISATATITGGNLATGGTASATGNITGGNILTGGLISATSTITSAANVIGGNLTTGGQVSATANVTGGNILTGGLISATGNITSATNVNTPNVVGASGLTISTGSGDLALTPSGNINASNNYINNLPDPVLAQDAASKQYVDDSVSAGLTIHTPVRVESPTALNGTYAQGGTTATVTSTVAGNTVVFGSAVSPQVNDQYWFTSAFSGILANTPYFVVSAPNTSAAVLSLTYSGAPVANITSATGLTQPVRINSGVGATLTNAGANATLVIDGVTLSNTNRVLIYTQANAVQNGVYVVSEAGNATTAWQLTRSTDTDVYGPKSTEELDAGDYFYVTSGDTGAGESYVMTAPTTPFIIGFDNLTFTQFSASQVYSANTAAGLSLIGTVFSAKVDGVTTAFDGGGNISVKASANLTTPNIGAATGTSLSVTGAVNAGTTVSAAGNITGGNVLTGGLISSTGAVTSGGFTTTGNVTGGNILSSGLGSFTGNVTAANFFGNISGNIDAAGANTQVQFNDTGDILGASAGFTFNKVGNILTANGNINGANLFTGGSVSATANITGGNVLTGGLISATSTITSAATITGGNLATGGTASATGNITGGNIATGGLITATGNITGANLILTSGIVDGPAAGRITINGSDIDTDFAVDGDTLANVFYVDAGTGTASFGASTQITNAIVNFATTTSIKAPVGNTAQRPATGVTGMLRFNTTTNAVEVFDNTAWTSVGVPVFTVVADEQFNGDGLTVAFTLGSTQTTNSCIVSINGVVQIPSSAYSVAGTNPSCVLTFTEAPASGDLIDVREITTTTTVTSISNSSGNAVIAVSPTSAQTNVTGDLSVSGSILGGNLNSTAITFGTSNMSIVSSGGNIRANIGGTTVQTISPGLVAIVGDLSVSGNATLSGNILGDRIQNGTTSFDIQTASGNANINIGGTGNLAVFAPGNLLMTGNISPTANITYDLGTNTNRWKDLWLSNSTIYLGNSQISANATSLIFTNPAGGQTVLAGVTAGITGATVSASGNITGGNILTGGLISATGAITGAALTGTSLTVSTGNITGGNLILTGAIQDSGQLDIQTTASNSNIVLTPNGSGNVNIGGNIMPTANATANIGSATLTYNTIFAKATSAQYADLAEKYTADAEYAPGTVVAFGGTAEVTLSTQDADRRVAGVVSTNPSYIMNGGLEGANIATVALTGRVPTKVTGTVAKGDLMVSNGDGTARAEADPRAGAIIGKALEDFAGGTGTIEVVIGRF
jgi:filamentous hemagglutinin